MNRRPWYFAKPCPSPALVGDVQLLYLKAPHRAALVTVVHVTHTGWPTCVREVLSGETVDVTGAYGGVLYRIALTKTWTIPITMLARVVASVAPLTGKTMVAALRRYAAPPLRPT